MTARRRKPKRETDLYEPVRCYLEDQGYTVRSEVMGCDIAATRGEELVVVEMKLRFGIDLLIQATQRQKVADAVYVAIPRPDGLGWTRKWRGIEHMLRRLELGLILVSFTGRRARVEVKLHPAPFTRRRQPKKRRAILREAAARTRDGNRGGSTGRKLLTAYRERAIHAAVCFEALGEASPRQLRELGVGDKAGAILYDNHYGWFERVGRGVYRLSEAGRAALDDYPESAAAFREAVAAARANAPE